MTEVFDLRTPEGIAAAEADLARFVAWAEICETHNLLEWGLISGRRRMLIDDAKRALTLPISST